MSTRSNPLLNLVQPIGGLFSRELQLTNAPGEPRFPIAIAQLGNVGSILPGFDETLNKSASRNTLDGAGGGLEAEDGRIRAVAEGLERYASCFYDHRQFFWATAAELGDEALDLDTVPRCSDAELRHPRCPLQRPDKNLPMRWIRGISMRDGRPVWIPAVMVYLHLPLASAGERFWLPISTGCAAHVNVERALTSAICEVIERDAVSLTWLQRLPLPRIELDRIPELLRPYVERNQRAAGMEMQFFDATSDLCVPTVYSVQLAPHNQTLAALVMCSTELEPATAIAKVIRESAASRIAMQAPQTVPACWDDFCTVSQGAAFMGRREQLGAYDFLLQSPLRRRLSEMPNLSTGEPRKDLANLLARLAASNLEVFAVDLSTDEALRAGMRVVRAIVPGLQPLSFSYRARFLGHPRLYEAPRQMGYRGYPEPEINAWPQPFA